MKKAEVKKRFAPLGFLGVAAVAGILAGSPIPALAQGAGPRAMALALEADETDMIYKTKDLLAQIRNSHSSLTSIGDFLDGDNYWLISPEATQLKKVFSENWKEILENVTEVAPTDIHRYMLFLLVECLPKQDALPWRYDLYKSDNPQTLRYRQHRP